MTEPTKIQRAIALNGIKTTSIPILDPALGDGKACYDKGFGLLNFTPKTSGGIPPWGADMNGFLYDLSNAAKYLNSGGTYVYDSAFQTAISGYPIGALLRRADGLGYWQSTVDGNMTNPDTGGAGWASITSKFYAAAAGTVNAITATFVPAIPALIEDMTVYVKASGANTIKAPTFSPNGLTAKTIVRNTGASLRVQDIEGANHILELKYNAALDKWILQNPSSVNSMPVGTITDWPVLTVPAGRMIEDGSAISRTTYADLFDLLVTSQGFTSQTFTVTIASPGVFTKTAHGFTGMERLRLSTTGALPTGLGTTLDYYVEPIDANTFYLLSAIGSARIVTTGTQSGTHSYLRSLYGLGDGTTTFNLRDMRGLFKRSLDQGAGIDAGRSIGTYQKGSAMSVDATGINAPYVSNVCGDVNQSTYALNILRMGLDAATANNYLNAATSYYGTGISTANIDAVFNVGATRSANMSSISLIQVT